MRRHDPEVAPAAMLAGDTPAPPLIEPAPEPSPPRLAITAMVRSYAIERLVALALAETLGQRPPDHGFPFDDFTAVIVDRPLRGHVEVHVTHEGKPYRFQIRNLTFEHHGESLVLSPCPPRNPDRPPIHAQLGVRLPGELSRIAVFDLGGISGVRLVDLGTHFVRYRTHLDLSTATAQFMHSVRGAEDEGMIRLLRHLRRRPPKVRARANPVTPGRTRVGYRG